MTVIKESAAYIRTRHSGNHKSTDRQRGPDMSAQLDSQHLLNLLTTPQTVDSLHRALSKDSHAVNKSRDEVVTALEYLFAQDLIELSPDS